MFIEYCGGELQFKRKIINGNNSFLVILTYL